MSTKQNILAFLENNRGKSISGSAIAAELNVSRSAVWKAIKELEKDGYRIKAVTNRGYCLKTDNDILSIQGITPHLVDKEAAEGIILYEEIDSTNRLAKEMAMSGALHNTIVMANSQTAGRGRYGRQFFSSSEGGIYMSFILRPEKLSFVTPTLITALAALSVCDAISEVTGRKPDIKWVNDIFIGDKKVSGILTEAVTDFESGSLQWIVVGIGVNFCIKEEKFPNELADIATSIYSDQKPDVTRNELAAEIINKFTGYSGSFTEKQILERYRQRLNMLGKRVIVKGQGNDYEAEALDIDETGRLIVKKDDGTTCHLAAGEISIKAI